LEKIGQIDLSIHKRLYPSCPPGVDGCLTASPQTEPPARAILSSQG
jgi:hypothetical protein